MITIRKVLCPVDLSHCSDRALAYAAELATKFGAELTVLYAVPDIVTVMPDGVMPVPVAGPDATEMLSDGRKAVADKLAALNLPGPVPAVDVRLGNAEEEIVAVAKELTADMIVIGTHGRTGLAHFFLGSVAEKVVRTAPCPVLSIHEGDHAG